MNAVDLPVRGVHVGGVRWGVVCAEFPTPGDARRAFDEIASALGEPDASEYGVGYYRHGTPRGPAHFLTAVGLEHGKVNTRLSRATRILQRAGGVDHRLEQGLAEYLVMRRVEQVRQHAGPLPSRAIRRGAV